MHAISQKITLPRLVLTNHQEDEETTKLITEAKLCEDEPLLFVPFKESETNIYFQSNLEAKLAIAAYLGRPLAILHNAQLQQIEAFIKQTMQKEMLLSMVKDYFQLRLVKGGINAY